MTTIPSRERIYQSPVLQWDLRQMSAMLDNLGTRLIALSTLAFSDIIVVDTGGGASQNVVADCISKGTFCLMI